MSDAKNRPLSLNARLNPMSPLRTRPRPTWRIYNHRRWSMPTATAKEKVRALVAAQLGSASYFLKIDGIRGESLDKQHRDEIELQSFAWGNSNAEPQGGASGTASGKVNFQDFQFAAPASKAGPQLMLQCATGQYFLGSSLVIIHSEDCLWAAEPRTSLRVCSRRDRVEFCQRSRRPRRLAALVETMTLMS